jgi:hypothetical protein
MALGCMGCRTLGVCGGLNIECSAFDCLSLCCNRPDDCDAVCRNNPEMFAVRVREVDGFSLENVPRAPVLAAPSLPPIVPVIFGGNRRAETFTGAKTACVSLYKAVGKTGLVRDNEALRLAARFKIAPETGIILTGTAVDAPIERWWSHGSERRRDTIRALRDLNIALVTTPNYSLFTDQPRWDDLYSIKRIGLLHEEFLQSGVPAALHVNARTERDWERWGEYIFARPEVTHIAFEFATGAGWAGRIDWHVTQLAKLAQGVNRPLHLVVRGGRHRLSALADAFPQMTLLDTDTYMRTIRRRLAVVLPSGAMRWRHVTTKPHEPLDALLAANWTAAERSYRMLVKPRAWMPKAA